MKVLIADKFPEKYVSDIQKLGLEVIYKPKLGADDLLAEAKATAPRCCATWSATTGR